MSEHVWMYEIWAEDESRRVNERKPPSLEGATFTLARVMSDISEEVYCAGWMQNTEWVLWRALADWREKGRAYWAPGSEFPGEITRHMPGLGALHQAADGWVWWLDGETFVPAGTWWRLVKLRELHPHDSNERLWERLSEPKETNDA